MTRKQRLVFRVYFILNFTNQIRRLDMCFQCVIRFEFLSVGWDSGLYVYEIVNTWTTNHLISKGHIHLFGCFLSTSTFHFVIFFLFQCTCYDTRAQHKANYCSIKQMVRCSLHKNLYWNFQMEISVSSPNKPKLSRFEHFICLTSKKPIESGFDSNRRLRSPLFVYFIMRLNACHWLVCALFFLFVQSIWLDKISRVFILINRRWVQFRPRRIRP